MEIKNNHITFYCPVCGSIHDTTMFGSIRCDCNHNIVLSFNYSNGSVNFNVKKGD